MKTLNITKSTALSRWVAKLSLKQHAALVIGMRIIETALNVAVTMAFAKIICNLGNDDVFKWIVIDIIIEAAHSFLGTFSHTWTNNFGNKCHNYYDNKLMNKLFSAKLTGVNTGTMQGYIDTIVNDKVNIIVQTIMMPAVLAPFIAVMIKMASTGCAKIMIIPVVSLAVSAVFGILSGNIRYTENSKVCAELKGTKTDVMLNVKTLRFLNKTQYAFDAVKVCQNKTLPLGSKVLRMNGYQLSYLLFLVPTLFSIMLIPSECRVENGTVLLTSVSSLMGSVNFILNFVDIISDLKENEEHIKCLDNVDTRHINSIKNGLVLDNFKCGYTRENGESLEFTADHVEIPYGSRTVITGASGTGKSTLANAIVGTVEATDFDPVKTFYIYQESELLDTTLRDNILLPTDEERINPIHSDEEIMDLIHKVGLGKWIETELENGLDTNVGERGAKVSSGQKQRINAIRAILKMREQDLDTLMILDEPTSNLDDETEKIVVDLFDKECKNTLLVITHRPEIEKICERRMSVTSDHKYISL